MTREIGVVTSSRADFGFIKPVLREILARPSLSLTLFVTGSHLGDHGTEGEILDNGFAIAARVPLECAVSTACEMADALGRGVQGFARLFGQLRPEVLVVIADRYEMFAAGVAGVTSGLVVAHISGGDLTEGMVDDSFRHALTKLCQLHFPTNELSAKRILQMGEEPSRVHVVGEQSLDALATTEWLTDEELAQRLDLASGDWEPPLLVTLHPAWLDLEKVRLQVDHLVAALANYQGLIVITSANDDAGGQIINARLRAFAAARPATRFVKSLGWVAYASLMRRVRAMVGNSSSGILEAPSFELPVVNIGHRQHGRLRAANVIDVADSAEAIVAGLERALSPAFRESLLGLMNPYYDGASARKIVDVLESVELGETMRMKRFQLWT